MEVGVRELKNNLSRYLHRVRTGSELVVTDHGRAVARVVPLARENGKPMVLDRLITNGVASPARTARRSVPDELIPATRPVSPLVSDQRR